MAMTTEKRAFGKMVLLLVLPVVGQNLLNMAVNTADVVMLGYVSQSALSASSLANQIQFILSLLFFGIGSGASILTAQYWGKGDTRTIEKVLGIALRFSIASAAVFALGAIAFPGPLMRIFTSDAELIAEGISYLRVVGVSYLFMAVTMMYLSAMSSMERVILSTQIYAVSLVVNIFGNAMLIFGWFGLPRLGILGVAISTTTARLVELVICLIDSRRNKYIRIRVRDIFARNKVLLQDFLRFALPAMGNDIVWGIGFSMYSVIMGHLGSDVVAANSIAQVVRNAAKVACSGISTGTAIIVGKALGQNLIDTARLYAKRMVNLTMVAAVIGGLMILALRPLIVNYGSITEQAREYLGVMLLISSYYVFGQAFNTTTICGVFRAGGDAKFGFILDFFDMWVFSVPLGFLCAFVFKLPVMWVYFVIFLDEFVKMPFIIVHYKRERWLQNITRESVG